jgi:hypothetical protein
METPTTPTEALAALGITPPVEEPSTASKPFQRRFTPEVAKQRVSEQRRRNADARQEARAILARAYPDEYRAHYEAAKARINAERGALPGDEVAS